MANHLRQAVTNRDDPGLQLQARALGDPTRYEVFRYVVDAEVPVGVAELTDHLGLNHNAIRQHLAKLVEAKLLAEQTAPHAGRGRPRLMYTLDPSAESRWGVMGPYERLSTWLAEVIRTGESPREVGRRIGSSDQAVVESASAVHTIVDEMRRQGFDPHVVDANAVDSDVVPGGSGIEIALRACPFETAAAADPETVCELHAGIVEAVVASMDGVELDGFVTVDPRKAGCRLKLRVTASDEGGDGN